MSAAVYQFAATCQACEAGLHDRCWQYLGELFGLAHVPCKCGCRDEHGELTHAALTDMARRQPDALARRIRFDAAIKRSSLLVHLRYAGPGVSGTALPPPRRLPQRHLADGAVRLRRRNRPSHVCARACRHPERGQAYYGQSTQNLMPLGSGVDAGSSPSWTMFR